MKPPASAIEILKKAVLLRNDIVHGRANTLTRETAASIVIAVRDLLYFLDAAQGREWALSHLSAEARNDFPQITSWPLLLTPPFRDSFDTTITRILSRGRAHCECLSRVPMGGRGREAKGEWTPAHESAQVTRAKQVRGYMPTCIARKAIRVTPPTGIGALASRSVENRSKRNGSALRQSCWSRYWHTIYANN